MSDCMGALVDMALNYDLPCVSTLGYNVSLPIWRFAHEVVSILAILLYLRHALWYWLDVGFPGTGNNKPT